MNITSPCRQRLIDAACRHSMLYDVSLRLISEKATGEKNFIYDVANGEEFSGKKYDMVMDWIAKAGGIRKPVRRRS